MRLSISCREGNAEKIFPIPGFDNIRQPVMHPFTARRSPGIRDVLRCFHAKITLHPNNRWRRNHSFEIAHTQHRHWSIRLIGPQSEIIFSGRFRGVATRIERSQGLLHIPGYAGRLRQQGSGAPQIFQRRLGERFMPRFEIKLGKTFARIPEAFRRVFLHQTGRKRHAFVADSRSASNCRNAIARCSPGPR